LKAAPFAEEHQDLREMSETDGTPGGMEAIRGRDIPSIRHFRLETLSIWWSMTGSATILVNSTYFFSCAMADELIG
jgi:hypothetical protein